jgi:hypothetical protein
MTTARALAAALLLAAPAGAAPRRAAQRELVGDALTRARRELRACRDDLEVLQELGLTPHSSDEPVESALLHLDLARGYLVWAEPELFAAIEPGPGGPSFDRRLKEALALLRARAPELADVYRTVPVSAAPLGGTLMAVFRTPPREILIRGYFAVNPPPAEYLAALLAHEAAHALQAASPGAPEGDAAAREREARRRESLLWIELGAGPERDFAGTEDAQARALLAGDAAFRTYVASMTAEPDWAWAAPARPAAPAAAATEAEAVSTAPATAAQELALVRESRDGSRRDYARGALLRLREARALLAETTELVAPYPKVVNADIMRIWALRPGHYPPAMTRAFAALTPVLDELDKADAALDAPRIDAAERERLKRYAGDRDAARAQTRAARALLERVLGGAAPPVYCFPYPAGLNPPSAIGLPGAWQCREGRPEIAAAWAAHVLAHRAQGLAPGAEPTLDQEAAAVTASLKAWADAGADAGFDPARPDRFLYLRAAADAGPEALRAYLKEQDYVRAEPPSPVRAHPRPARKRPARPSAKMRPGEGRPSP